MTHDAITDNELLDGDAKTLRGHLQQRLAGRRAGERKIGVIEILRMRLRSGCHSLIRSRSGLTLNQLHAVDGDTQFFCDELRLCGVEALAELAFSGIRGDAAVRRDGEPAIDVFRGIAHEARHGLSECVDWTECETDDERARAFQQSTAREVGWCESHSGSPRPT